MTAMQMQMCRRQMARMRTVYKPPRILVDIANWFESVTQQFGQIVGTLFLVAVEVAAFIIYVYIDYKYISPQTALDDIDEYPIPKNLFYVQTAFSFFFVASWALLLVGADESIRHQLLSIRSLTTMITALPQLMVFFWQFVEPEAASGFVPMFLRVWWIHYYVLYLISLPDVPLGELARDTIGVLSPLLAVMVTSAGAYSITVRLSNDRNITFFDAFYFSFVTFGTIGFGDLSPKTDYGYVLVICMIISAIYIFPNLFSRLTSIIQRRKLHTEFHTEGHKRHVIIVGTFRLQDVKFILGQFFTGERLKTKVVFFSKAVYSPEIYLFVSSPVYRGRVSLIVGSPKVSTDLDRCSAKTADAIFVMSGHGNFTNVDFDNVSTVFSLHHYDKELPIHVSLKRATTRHFVSSTAAVVMVGEIIKMNLLGLGAVLPGALPLIINLVRNYDNPHALSHRLLEAGDTSDEEERDIIENESTEPVSSPSTVHASFAQVNARVATAPDDEEEEHIITQEQIANHATVAPKPQVGGVASTGNAKPKLSKRQSSSSSGRIARVAINEYAPWQILNGWSVGNELYTVPVPTEFVGSEFTALSLAMASYTVTIIGVVDPSQGVVLNPGTELLTSGVLLVCIAQDITHIADGLQALHNAILQVPEARFRDAGPEARAAGSEGDIEMSQLVSVQVRKGNSRLVMRHNRNGVDDKSSYLPGQEEDPLDSTVHGRFRQNQKREQSRRKSEILFRHEPFADAQHNDLGVDFSVSLARRPDELDGTVGGPRASAQRLQTGQQTVLGEDLSPFPQSTEHQSPTGHEKAILREKTSKLKRRTLDKAVLGTKVANFAIFANNTAVWAHRRMRGRRDSALSRSTLTGWTRNIFGPAGTYQTSSKPPSTGARSVSQLSRATSKKVLKESSSTANPNISTSDAKEEPERIESLVIVRETAQLETTPQPEERKRVEDTVFKAPMTAQTEESKSSEDEHEAAKEEAEEFVAVAHLTNMKDLRALSDHLVLIDLYSCFNDVSSTTDATGDEMRAIDLFTVLHPIKCRDASTPIVLLSMMEKNANFEEIWEEHNYETILQITGCGANVSDLAKCNLEKAKAVLIFASGQAESEHSDELSLLVTLSVRQAIGDRKIPVLTEIDHLESLYVFQPHYSNGYSLASATMTATGADKRAREHFAFAASVLTGSVLAAEMLEITLFHNYFNPYLLKVVEALIGGSASSNTPLSPSQITHSKYGKKAHQPSSSSAVVGLSCMPNCKKDPFGERYIDVVRKFAAERVVVVGLFRVIRDGRHEELNGHRFMLTNPPPSTKVLADDIVYYLSK